MLYIDTGGRDSSNAVGAWFQEIISQEDVSAIHVQTGFFSSDSIPIVAPLLEWCAHHDLPTTLLIGSNDAHTLRDDIASLIKLIRVPRPKAKLGVVSFSGGYFHPKTYHIHRSDGSQTAYIGSANLTGSGLTLHVEAGICLDTRIGDPENVLSQISDSIDSWFSEERPGLTPINGEDSLDSLVESGILSISPPPRVRPDNTSSQTTGSSSKPRLKRLISLPSTRADDTEDKEQSSAESGDTTTSPHTLPSVPRPGFPQYILFEPHATSATNGRTALTGAPLPGNAKGLIVRLNRDSARHFEGRSGTANISIPVATISTLRFGIAGIHKRPACKFELHYRYIGDDIAIDGGTAIISVMGYGFTTGESGHGDIRMLVPAAVRSLVEAVENEGAESPRDGHLAFLEWPPADATYFRLSFIDPGSMIYKSAESTYQTAETSQEIVGNGACWLF